MEKFVDSEAKAHQMAAVNGCRQILSKFSYKVLSLTLQIIWKSLQISAIICVFISLILLSLSKILSVCFMFLSFAAKGCLYKAYSSFSARQTDLATNVKRSFGILKICLGISVVDTLEIGFLARYFESFQSSNSSKMNLPKTTADAVQHLTSFEHKNAFMTLMVDERSNFDMIKQNYRKMALLVHPDKSQDCNDGKAIKILNNAYQILTDETKRCELIKQMGKKERTRKVSQACVTKQQQTLSCMGCGGEHIFLETSRMPSKARFCLIHNMYHEAKEFDVWVESYFGRKYLYCCIRIQHQLKIYSMKEWSHCQDVQFNHLPSNHHQVFMRFEIASSRSRSHRCDKEAKDIKS